MLVDPISPATNFFVGFWNALPSPVKAISLLAFGCFGVVAFVRIIRK